MNAKVYIVNFFLFVGILALGWNANDKTIIVAYALYVVLFALNVMFGLFRQMDNKLVFKHYYASAFALALLGIIIQIVF